MAIVRGDRRAGRVARPGPGEGGLRLLLACLAVGGFCSAQAAVSVYLTGVPDYQWNYGCFGTATGNLIGYWDRHGFPDFYTGPTGGGLAPLNSFGANGAIFALWASRAGSDGRPANMPGHVDDYYVAYESTAADPSVTAKRAEHSPDCIGDFIGLNQLKWKFLNGECDGNIDGYSFVYWDANGARRLNYTPGPQAGLPATDIQSGLRAWAAYRGYQADTFTQLSDFNPTVRAGEGFKFADLKAEIDAGYPVLLFMQDFKLKSRVMAGLQRANPLIHGMLAYGYYIPDFGSPYVRYRTSWATGDSDFSPWTADSWTPEGQLHLPLRGVIGFHPLPRIRSVQRAGVQIVVRWDGPGSQLYDSLAGTTTPLHRYVVERATSLSARDFVPVTAPTTEHQATLPDCCPGAVYFRVKLLPP